MAITAAGLNPANVTVAGTGGVWLAPSGTALPAAATLTTDPATPYRRVGYTTDDGVKVTLARKTTELPVWESPDPIRTLVTAEPKSIKFTTREFSPENFQVVNHGGDLAVVTGVAEYTPPDAGSSADYAMLIVWLDGGYTYRLGWPRVDLDDDVEFDLLNSESINLPLSWKVLASPTKWVLHTDDPEWLAAAA